MFEVLECAAGAAVGGACGYAAGFIAGIIHDRNSDFPFAPLVFGPVGAPGGALIGVFVVIEAFL